MQWGFATKVWIIDGGPVICTVGIKYLCQLASQAPKQWLMGPSREHHQTRKATSQLTEFKVGQWKLKRERSEFGMFEVSATTAKYGPALCWLGANVMPIVPVETAFAAIAIA